ncbi:hypothetical protein ACFYNW_20035 [Streptomyces virginiae]|uniref:hypothetical protein n=1 Tax=Streptomyces virginiae TaxID=1961 RepID=UPI0033B2B527
MRNERGVDRSLYASTTRTPGVVRPRGDRWSHRHVPAPPEQDWKIHTSAGRRRREIAAPVIGT